MQGRESGRPLSRQGPPKCPVNITNSQICRQVFHSLLQISLPDSYVKYSSARLSRNQIELKPENLNFEMAENFRIQKSQFIDESELDLKARTNEDIRIQMNE